MTIRVQMLVSVGNSRSIVIRSRIVDFPDDSPPKTITAGVRQPSRVRFKTLPRSSSSVKYEERADRERAMMGKTEEDILEF